MGRSIVPAVGIRNGLFVKQVKDSYLRAHGALVGVRDTGPRSPFSGLVCVRTSVGPGGRRYAVTLSNGSIGKQMKLPVLQRTRDVGSGRTARDTEVLVAARLPSSNHLTRPII